MYNANTLQAALSLKNRPTGVSDHLLVVVFLIPRCECRDPPSDTYSPNLLCIVPLLWNAKDLTVAAVRYLYCFYNYSSLSFLFRLVQ